jgi:PhnB protein
MKINAYLNFPGTCREAFTLYEQALGGKILFMQSMGDSPMGPDTPPEQKDFVMHVTLDVDGQLLMGSDAPPEYYEKAQGFSVALHPETVAEAERIFAALSEGGEVRMPLEETFWAARFGMCVDRFGTPWSVNCEKDG